MKIVRPGKNEAGAVHGGGWGNPRAGGINVEAFPPNRDARPPALTACRNSRLWRCCQAVHWWVRILHPEERATRAPSPWERANGNFVGMG